MDYVILAMFSPLIIFVVGTLLIVAKDVIFGVSGWHVPSTGV